MAELDTITLTRTDFDGETTAEFNVPRKLGSVRLVREIGRGGMGVVWLGRDELLEREVAIKFLLNALAGPDDPQFTRFIEGARAAARVRHTGLTVIHHADVVAGIPYLVMEYVAGPSLADVRRRCGPLGAREVVNVLCALGDAIGALHDQGIIHQDLKPANVLLDVEGHTYLTDFGLSHVRARLSEADAERLAGTPAYMAPEMLVGQVSVRSDVYALGITAFELLTGRVPFAGPLSEVRRMHREQPLPVEQLRECNVPEGLIAVLERATNKDALYRYKTARHMIRALAEASPETADEGTALRQRALLVSRAQFAADRDSELEATSKTPSAYYETLAARAAAKRSDAPRAPPRMAESDEFEEASETPAAAATERAPAEARWLARMRGGQTFVLVGAVCSAVELLLYVVARSLETFAAATSAAGDWITHVGDLVAAGIMSVGVLLTLSLRFALALRPEQPVLSWFVRGLVPLWLGLLVVSLVSFAGGRPAVNLAYLEAAARERELAFDLFAATSSFAIVAGMWLYLASVVRRLGDERLVRRLSGGALLLATLACGAMAGTLGVATALADWGHVLLWCAASVLYLVVTITLTRAVRALLKSTGLRMG